MLRSWCEYLDYSELRDPGVLRMLSRWEVHPIVAVRPDADFAELAEAIRAIRDIGLQPGVWPLLDEAHGYWPSERNVGAWTTWTTAVIERLKKMDAMPAWVAVDLEPPLSQVSHLLRRPLYIPAAAAALAVENMDLDRFHRARRELHDAVRALQGQGLSVLGVTLPLAAHDLRDDVPLWQDMFETPWAGIGWDAAGIMAYGSIVSGASKGLLSTRDTRALHQPLLAHLGRRFGSRAHASLGVTGTGVFGDEPTYESPEELALDASAARAAGVTDLAVFCLEGILARPCPESWLAALAEAPPRTPPPTWKSRSIRACGAAVRWGGRALFRR